MLFTNAAFLSILAASVAAVPTPTTPQDVTPAGVVARDTKYTDTVNPNRPHISYESQCVYRENFAALYAYNVVVAHGTEFNKGRCGSGFLDNLHGHGCTVTQWGCQYSTDPATGIDYMEANFQADLGCDGGDVGAAIYKAFGHLKGIDCVDYDSISDIDLPPVDLPVGV